MALIHFRHLLDAGRLFSPFSVSHLQHIYYIFYIKYTAFTHSHRVFTISFSGGGGGGGGGGGLIRGWALIPINTILVKHSLMFNLPIKPLGGGGGMGMRGSMRGGGGGSGGCTRGTVCNV